MKILIHAIASINRAIKQKQLSTIVPYNRLTVQCLRHITYAGYLRGFNIISPLRARVYIKFDIKGNPLIKSLTCISRPGNRVYATVSDLKHFQYKTSTNSPLTTLLLTTSKGLKFDRAAVLQSLGGELLLKLQ